MSRALLLSLLVACAACGGRVVIDGEQGSSGTMGGGGAGGMAPCTLPGSPPTSEDSPLLWYPLDGNASNAGSLGHAYDGAPTDVAWLPAKGGEGADVGSGWIDFPGTRDVLSSAQAITIALWLKPDFTALGEPFLDCRSFGAGFHSYHGGDPGTTITTCSDAGCGTFDVGDTGWHHVVYRYASSAPGGVAPLDIYVDGNLAVTVGGGEPLFGMAVNDLTLGRHNVGSGFGPAHWVVDDLRVYDQVFSEEEQCTQLIGGSWCGTACQLP